MNPNEVLDTCFPFVVSKSAVPDGAELMNRVAGKRSEPSGPGRTGRPPKPESPAIQRLQDNVDPRNPYVTALAIDPDDSLRWLSGSVVRVVFADGSEQAVVLLDDVSVAPWIDESQ